MKLIKINHDFLMICSECGDLIELGYEIQFTKLNIMIILCDSCTKKLSKDLLQETYFNNI